MAKNRAALCRQKSDVGRTAADNRLFINAVLFIARSGSPWRDLPERYGNVSNSLFPEREPN